MLSSPKLPLDSSIGAEIVLSNGEPTQAMQRYRRMLGETLPDGDGRCRKAVRTLDLRDDLGVAPRRAR
jgi:hypothetical protein